MLVRPSPNPGRAARRTCDTGGTAEANRPVCGGEATKFHRRVLSVYVASPDPSQSARAVPPESGPRVREAEPNEPSNGASCITPQSQNRT
jgi:hypothetical protein